MDLPHHRSRQKLRHLRTQKTDTSTASLSARMETLSQHSRRTPGMEHTNTSTGQFENRLRQSSSGYSTETTPLRTERATFLFTKSDSGTLAPAACQPKRHHHLVCQTPTGLSTALCTMFTGRNPFQFQTPDPSLLELAQSHTKRGHHLVRQAAATASSFDNL